MCERRKRMEKGSVEGMKRDEEIKRRRITFGDVARRAKVGEQVKADGEEALAEVL